MNRGGKLVQQMVKNLEKDLQRKSQSYSQVNSNKCIESAQEENNSKEKSQQRRLVVRKKEKNFQTRVYTLYPRLQDNHIFRLFGFMGINEKAFQNPAYEESLIYSHFDSRVIQRVQIFDYAVVIEMTEPVIPFNQPRVEYVIEKYKSKGQTKFYELATLIEEICQLLKLSSDKPPPEEKIESVKKWLDFLGDQMYVCTLGPRKFAISKSLLTYLEYDIQQFALEATKYRSIFCELFTSVNYSRVLPHLLKCLKHTAQLFNNKISFTQFKQLTTYHFSDFIQSKNHVRSFCDMTLFLLNPTFLCHKINFIYYKEDAKDAKRQKNGEMILAIEEQKQRIREEEFKTIKKVKTVPRHLLKENKRLFASYKTVENNAKEEENQQKPQ